MGLHDRVRIAPRFQRAVRIDADLHNPTSLDGFLCTRTFARSLTTIAEQVGRTGQGAFTWTGPYGGGKSSLVVALAALLGPRGRQRAQAQSAVGPEVAKTIAHHLKPGATGWKVIPVMGARANPATLVSDALVSVGAVREATQPNRRTRDVDTIDAVVRVSQRPHHAGLLLVIDELGKVLEHLAATGGDLHFFQELAERASRSNGRLVVLGILHQAFDEYAGRMNKEARDEWAKVQGRYLDIPLTVAGSEQLEILSRAIESSKPPKAHADTADAVTKALRTYRLDTPASIAAELRRCWPLHPVTSCVLGPISRRRFGQNHRSLFAFLNSYEPAGFQEFLSSAGIEDRYTPDLLFDYLQLNLEPAILASPDGHRWALAVEALERAEKNHAKPLHLALLKSIALLDLFRERSGLYASLEVLRTLVDAKSPKVLDEALDDLKGWSVIAYREHLSAFAIYAGSDFDLQAALDEASEKVAEPNLTKLKQLGNLRPIVAKRHYHDTGALRWFDVDLVALADLERRLSEFKPNGATGQFLLVLLTGGEAPKAAKAAVCAASARSASPTVLGSCGTGRILLDRARELLALELIRKDRPELSSDAVARREVDARAAAAASALESEVRNAFSEAHWFSRGEELQTDGLAGLARLASDLADGTYESSPRIRNELLNRSAPSSNAVAAQKALLKAMVASPFMSRVGIQGFPAEGGLYESVLASTGLHVTADSKSGFHEPGRKDPANLKPLWKATDAFLKRATIGPVSAAEVYALWQAPPFGVREGLRPVLFVAYLISRADRFTVYIDEQLEVALTDLTVDRLAQDPTTLTVRVFDAGERERRFFDGMRDAVRQLRGDSAGDLSETLDLAKAVVGIVKMEPPFSQRTIRLQPAATAIRAALRSASDAHTLLHESLPRAVEQLIGRPHPPVDECCAVLKAALDEIVSVYARELGKLNQVLQRELGFADSEVGLKELHVRAHRIQGLTGDFRLEAFITRLATYRASTADIESIASLAANKPPRDWSDNDVDRATLELADLAQRFNRAEAFARVKGRQDGRHAIAFVVGLDRAPELAAREFEITEGERRTVLQIAREIKSVLQSVNARDEVVLAALAQVGSDVLATKNAKRRRAVNE